MNSTHTLPAFAIHMIAVDTDTIILQAEVVSNCARCPCCQTISFRVHGRYIRHPSDLPWRGCPVRLRVLVRRFPCENPACKRLSFAENCGQSLPRYARRTLEATQRLREIVQVAGGEAGARLASADGLPVSSDTLLRLQRQAVPSSITAPRILGVDDLALRRGQIYATLVVDLETGRCIDLLEARDAEVFANWLKARPGVEIIARDRGHDDAEGAQAGAPQAIQAADRFHLVQNASNALDGMLRGRRLNVAESLGEPADADLTEAAVSATTEPSGQDAVVPAAPHASVQPSPAKPLSPTKQYLAERKVARLARWEKMNALAHARVSISEIAQQIGISRKTVRVLIRTPGPPRNRVEQRRPAGLTSPTLQPSVTYLQDRWQAGCTNVAQLFPETAERGYPGSVSLPCQAI